MSCNHKFQSDLNLEHLDFKPTTLIVGTFNPAWSGKNTAEWFYGRITGSINNSNAGNHFWAVLPRLYGQQSLKALGRQNEWKKFCHDHKVAITDLISCIEDADENNPLHCQYLAGYSDTAITEHFKKFKFVPVTKLLQQNPTIKNVYLTRGIGPTFWKNLWKPVQQYCSANRICCKALITPSDYAFYQLGRYNNLHPESPLNREDFILMRWREQWCQNEQLKY